MKKLFGLLCVLMFASNIQTFALGIEIQPTMQSRSNAQDRVWVGTFQLVWNDFIDRVIHNPIRFREGTPIMVQELNRKSFSTEDISDKCYYKTITKVTPNAKKQIEKAIHKKFKENSDLLEKMNLSPRNDKYLIYAMLKKDFEFQKEFNKLGKSHFGENQVAEYFGIINGAEGFEKSIKVLFYNNPNDFAINLATKGDDEVYIYKNSANKEFQNIYADMLKKETAYKGIKEFNKNDELKIPNISFYEEKAFEELEGKRIMGTNLQIDQAIESIKFNMDNKGVKLKSEAVLSYMTLSLKPEEEPRFFYVDDTFVIFLKEKGKKNPYFAARVHDIKKFQK